MANPNIEAALALRKCSILGCEKPVKTAGLCSMHAERKRVHGDPLRGAKSVRGVCSVEGCEKPHIANGLCSAHNRRRFRHGSPLGGGCQRNVVRPWLDQIAVNYSGDECLRFPFKRDRNGYGRVNIGGAIIGSHVYVLTAAKGKKPSIKHEACHRCGNGDDGCVTPNHLYWGTRLENVRDAISHGTAYFPKAYSGDNHPRAKYTIEQIRNAIALVRGGTTQIEAVKITGVRQQTISRVLNGLSWKGSI